jgi:hypothetical protein
MERRSRSARRDEPAGTAAADPADRTTIATPRVWADWALRETGTLDAWLAGATVLDPTCGRGEFLLALVSAARARGVSVGGRELRRLFGVERRPEFLWAVVGRARAEFDLEWPRENLWAGDFLHAAPAWRVDRVVGNPPWRNFTDLPPDEKPALKPLFHRYGLVGDARRLLLGGSRIDLAALVVAKSIADHPRPAGRAAFFLPLSILLNDGAHAGFRRYRAAGVPFAVERVYDCTGLDVFPSVATRYGLVEFRRNREPHFPVPYRIGSKSDGWRESWAAPLDEPGGPLAVADDVERLAALRDGPRVRVPPGCRPRQGVNTCGGNRALVFTELRRLGGERVEARSAALGAVILPRRFLYPLIGREQFADPSAPPRRHVLLACDEATGQPLSPPSVAREPLLADYLHRARPLLERRAGRLLSRWPERGIWWALLGVGPYSFAPFKVAWRAYGQDTFEPQLFDGLEGRPWQGDQALHAYLPCETRDEAEKLLNALSDPRVTEYLRAFRMAGTRSWAQPGRVARLLQPQDPPLPVASPLAGEG